METLRERRLPSAGVLHRVALVRTESSASIIRGTRIGELRMKLAVTSNGRKLRRSSYKSHTV
jgi:hypothetical protein